jgi:tyrosine-protein phosphatase SIW14
MARSLKWLLGTLLVAFLIGGPLGYARYRTAHFRNFQPVTRGLLYRSGQLSIDGLQRMILAHGIKTVITLRDAKAPGEPPPDAAEERHCLRQELYYYRLPPLRWWKQDGVAPADVNVARFLEIMDDPRHHPVLIHCYAGTHRTGAFVGIYRMEYQHWSNARVIEELKARGYDDIESQKDIYSYLLSYEPRWRRTLAP